MKEVSQTPKKTEKTIQGHHQEPRFLVLHPEVCDDTDRLSLDTQSGRRTDGKKGGNNLYKNKKNTFMGLHP